MIGAVGPHKLGFDHDFVVIGIGFLVRAMHDGAFWAGRIGGRGGHGERGDIVVIALWRGWHVHRRVGM